MKAYGVPRVPDLDGYPDVADGRLFGVKARLVNLPGKSGDIRSNFKNPASKQQSRRYWARVERAQGKAECSNGIKEILR